VTLPASRRSELRAQAHALSPVVIIGDKGLTEEVVKEIDRSLKAHELIKVRAMSADRKSRGEWMVAICAQLGAENVQEIGKMLVIYRKNPEETPIKKTSASGLGSRRPTKSLGGRLLGNDKPSEKPRGNHKLRGTDKPRGSGLRETDKPRGKKFAPRDKDVKGSERPRSRTPSPRPESEPRRRRPRTSR
jgi:RNA-binding protein